MHLQAVPRLKQTTIAAFMAPEGQSVIEKEATIAMAGKIVRLSEQTRKPIV